MAVEAKYPASAQGPVVVGFDGSAAANEALRWGAQQANVRGVPLQIVRAFECRATADSAGSYLRAYDLAHGRALLEVAGARRRVESEFPRLAIGTAVAAGRPSRVLERYARDASLVVVASRRRPRVLQWLAGSVTNNLTGRVRCPVMSLPACATAL